MSSEKLLLSRKHIVKNDEVNNRILRHMGYAAYKLWNIGNYEKRNYKELKLEKYPDWYDQKKRLKTNFFFKNLPSQTAQEVLKQLEESYKSYFTLRKKYPESNYRPPRFKNNLIDITFLKDAIKSENGVLRLTIPKQLKTYLKSQEKIESEYIYLKVNRFDKLKKIKTIEIKFIDEKSFAVIAVYEDREIELKSDNGKYLSIDLGIKNPFTCFDSSKGNAFIVNGFLRATHYYDKKIAYYQSINAAQQAKTGVKYPKLSKRVKKLYEKKSYSVFNFIHKASRTIAEYCYENDINTVVIGDIKGIRSTSDGKGRNIGRNNQQLHSLPYDLIYQKLEYKLKRMGIRLIKVKEAYSSSCLPDSEKVSKSYADKSLRVKRGLIKDNKDRIFNADAVGAYNILRLYFQKTEKTAIGYTNLSSLNKVTV